MSWCYQINPKCFCKTVNNGKWWIIVLYRWWRVQPGKHPPFPTPSIISLMRANSFSILVIVVRSRFHFLFLRAETQSAPASPCLPDKSFAVSRSGADLRWRGRKRLWGEFPGRPSPVLCGSSTFVSYKPSYIYRTVTRCSVIPQYMPESIYFWRSVVVSWGCRGS